MSVRKAWAFVLDGHIFYVLGTTNRGTLLYDLSSGQWHVWKTGGRTYWNMERGVMWRGRILAADNSTAQIWELDPDAVRDESVPAQEIERVVTGFLPLRGRDSVRQGALRLTASVGDPSVAGAAVTMRYSDDGGNTWSNPFTVTLAEGDFDQTISFRSLGRIRAPGRLWEITDTGAAVRIDGADADLDIPKE